MEAMGKDAEDADYLMENVAIATIGDVMDLVDEKMCIRDRNINVPAVAVR